VRLHPVVLQLGRLRSKHVCEVPQSYTCGHVAGGGQELGARVVAFCVPGAVLVGGSQWMLRSEKGRTDQRLMLRDVMGGEVSSMRRHKCARGNVQAYLTGIKVMFSRF
jgi:hypothetical protein